MKKDNFVELQLLTFSRLSSLSLNREKCIKVDRAFYMTSVDKNQYFIFDALEMTGKLKSANSMLDHGRKKPTMNRTPFDISHREQKNFRKQIKGTAQLCRYNVIQDITYGLMLFRTTTIVTN